jgi:hypothetical protein
MSLEVREDLQESLIFQNSVAQKHQLTEVEGAAYVLNTYLINVMWLMRSWGMFYVITALRDDHSFDGTLGPDNHNPAGRAMDFWFLKSRVATDYLEPDSEQFVAWMSKLTTLPRVTGVGLGGGADTGPNREALGNLYFHDGDSDHVHIQVSD